MDLVAYVALHRITAHREYRRGLTRMNPPALHGRCLIRSCVGSLKLVPLWVQRRCTRLRGANGSANLPNWQSGVLRCCDLDEELMA
jgi:hypothetical protein